MLLGTVINFVPVFAAWNPYSNVTQDTEYPGGDGHNETPCTKFAWQQAYDNLGVELPAWGNAKTWYDSAKNAGYSVGSVARANSIAVWSDSGAGHVAYVTSASSDTTFTVNEGGRVDLDGGWHWSNGAKVADIQDTGGIAWGYTITEAVGQARPYSTGQYLTGFIYLDGAPKPVEVSLSWSDSDLQYDTKDANMHIKANTNVSGSFTEAGITVWNGAGAVIGTKSEQVNYTSTYMEVYYTLSKELGLVLNEGSDYSYQFYVVFNGQKYTSDKMNFTTKGQKENSWDEELTVSSLVYGDGSVLQPTAKAKYGTPVFTYSTEENGEYTSVAPTDAGAYYVKATVAATDEYKGLEAIKEVIIHKGELTPKTKLPDSIEVTYGTKLKDIALPEGWIWFYQYKGNIEY